MDVSLLRRERTVFCPLPLDIQLPSRTCLNASQSELLMLEQLRTRANVLFRLVFSACGIVLIGISCGDGDGVGPTTQGTIRVAATTVGLEADVDPNGYTVELSTGEKTPIPVAGT